MDPHIDDLARPGSWASRQRAALATPRVVGSLTPQEIEALLIAARWSQEWAKRGAAGPQATIDASLLGQQGLYFGGDQPRIAVSPQYGAPLVAHEYQHWYDDTWGAPGMDRAGMEAEFSPYVLRPGPYTVFARGAERATKEMPTDEGHWTHAVVDAANRDVRRLPPSVAAGRFGWMADQERAGTLGHRLQIPMVTR